MNKDRVKMQRRELGVIAVDCGDVVCLSMDAIYTIVERLRGAACNDNPTEWADAVDRLIHELGGVVCGFAADGRYGVDKTVVLTETARHTTPSSSAARQNRLYVGADHFGGIPAAMSAGSRSRGQAQIRCPR